MDLQERIINSAKELVNKLGKSYRTKPVPQTKIRAYQSENGNYLVIQDGGSLIEIEKAKFEAEYEPHNARPRKTKDTK